MTKRKRTKRQTMMYTKHYSDPSPWTQLKSEGELRDSRMEAVPAPHVAPIVFICPNISMYSQKK
jgi:hypothetical protein